MGFLCLRSSQSAGGGEMAPSGNAGINEATQNVTADYWRLDLGSSDFNSSNLLNLSGESVAGATHVRSPTCTYSASGGPFSRGYNRFVPGHYIGSPENPGGEHNCGIGQILGLTSFSSNTARFTLGMLVRIGSGWFTEGSGNKEVIVLRGGGPTERPMIIPKIGSSTTILAACDGTVCNCNDDLTPREYGNDSNSIPDQELLYGTWQYIEMQMDTTSPGLVRLKIWDENSVYNGTQIIMTDLNEGAGGTLTGVDIINYVTAVETPSGNCYKDVAYIEGWNGTITDRGPPLGFAGSFR